MRTNNKCRDWAESAGNIHYMGFSGMHFQSFDRGLLSLAILLTCSLLAGACTPKFDTYEVELTSESPTFTLSLPHDMKPELDFYSITNESGEPIFTPRLLINGQPRTWSIGEVIESCESNGSRSRDLAVCLFDFLGNHMEHGFPGSLPPLDESSLEVLTAVNDLGLYECWTSSYYLCQLAQAAGIKGRTVHDDSGHVVAELFWDEQWHLFDVDRKLYWVGKNENDVLSLDRLREPSTGYWRSARGRRNPIFLLLDRVLLTGEIEHKDVRAANPDYPALYAKLPDQAHLIYDNDRRRELGGTFVLMGMRSKETRFKWNPPYPLLTFGIVGNHPIEATDLHTGQSLTAETLEMITFDYSAKIKWLSQRQPLDIKIHSSTVDPDASNMISIKMRLNDTVIPRLRGGDNQLELVSQSANWKVKLSVFVQKN
jgi:hypothetical protein